jgi:hypothetical protein
MSGSIWEALTRRQISNFLSSSRFLDLLLTIFISEKNYSQAYVLPNRLAIDEQSSYALVVISLYKSRTRICQNVHFRYVSHYIYVIYISNSAVIVSMLLSNGMKINWLWLHTRVYLETGSWIFVEEASFFCVSRRFRSQNWEVCHYLITVAVHKVEDSSRTLLLCQTLNWQCNSHVVPSFRPCVDWCVCKT